MGRVLCPEWRGRRDGQVAAILINALRGHLMAFGFIVRHGPGHVSKLVGLVADPSSELPAEAM